MKKLIYVLFVLGAFVMAAGMAEAVSFSSATRITFDLDMTGDASLDGAVTINDSSADVDTRIESNGNENAIFVDAGNDRVGIFTAAPSVPLEVTGNTIIEGSVTINESSADLDTRIESNNDDYIFFVDAGNDRVGIGPTTPDTFFHVEDVTTATNAVENIVRITHDSSGVHAAGIGIGVQFEQETSAANFEIMGEFDLVTTDVTGASEDADFVFSLMAAGAAASEVARITSTGVLQLVNDGTIDNSTNGIITVDEPSSATNTVVNTFKVSHSTSGSPATGIGTGLALETETSASNLEVGVVLEAVTTDATGASEDFDFVVKNMDAGGAATERFRVDSDGITTQTGGTGAIKTYVYQNDAIADDASINLPDATDGFLIATCGTEGGNAIISADGTVTLTAGITTNMVAADTDAKFAVFDGGTYATVRNRLGAACVMRVVYYYQ